ncbi:hypothetical protein ODJ79_32815 [Actinoplanes sp. KI2]|uniref:TolB family protein n=1 Tax=Actinoplanes sp. KI2 TaxID=2983315 RepID=UPI0021D5F27C|nr:hypothetical protein [Actinoplanes sp. KI2]MCU7728519.1 hypothetical protein [Actinoplanes sp. KI2]
MIMAAKLRPSSNQWYRRVGARPSSGNGRRTGLYGQPRHAFPAELGGPIVDGTRPAPTAGHERISTMTMRPARALTGAITGAALLAAVGLTATAASAQAIPVGSAAAALASGIPAHADGTAGTTTAVAVTPDGKPDMDSSDSSSVSADGRYVAFRSASKRLVPGDTKRSFDIFVRDRQAGTVERVSVDSAGHQGSGDSDAPSISADGRFVAFNSKSANLVPGDTNGWSDVFVHDRQTGTTERVSQGTGGEEANWDSFNPSLSADGRFVVFESAATNLVAGDTNDVPDAFVVDRQTGRTERVSVDSYGRQATDIVTQSSISADGRYVAFVSAAPNLDLRPDTNHAADVFVHDRSTAETERVSLTAAGTQASGPSLVARISGDGRHVAFEADGNLVPDDTNNQADIYVRDLNTGALTWASREEFRRPTETPGRTPTVRPAISADGRFVAFTSGQHGLVPNDGNGRWDVFVRDVQTGGIELASSADDGTQATGESRDPSISADGRFVAFTSYAQNLVPGADDESDYLVPHVFLHDRGN